MARLNHTPTPFNTHARRRARNGGAERDKPDPGEKSADSATHIIPLTTSPDD